MSFSKKSLPNITEKTLDGGVRIIFVSSRRFKQTHASLNFNIGQLLLDHRDFSALHLLEHVVLDGNKNFPAPEELLSEHTGASNGELGGEISTIWIRSPHQLFERNLNVICDLLLEPLINEEKLTNEKNVVFEEMQERLEYITHGLSGNIERLLWVGSPYGDEAGALAAIEHVSLAGLEEIYQRFINSLQLIVVAGNFNEEKVWQKLEHSFGQIRTEPPRYKSLALSSNLPALSVIPAHFDQSLLYFSYGMPIEIDDPAYYPLCFLEEVTGSRENSPFYRSLRKEKKLIYNIDSHLSVTSTNATLVTDARFSGERTKEGITSILEEFDRLKTTSLDETYVRYLADDWLASLTSYRDEPDFWSDLFVYTRHSKIPPGELLVHKAAMIEKVTAQDILRIAQRLFQPNQFVTALAGRYLPDEIREIEALIQHLLGLKAIYIDPQTKNYMQSLAPKGKLIGRLTSLFGKPEK